MLDTVLMMGLVCLQVLTIWIQTVNNFWKEFAFSVLTDST